MSSAALSSKGSKYLGKKDGDTFSNIKDAHTLTRLSKGWACHRFQDNDVLVLYCCTLDASVLMCDWHWECEGKQEGFNPESASSQ